MALFRDIDEDIAYDADDSPPCERHPLDYISCVDEYGAQTCAWCGANPTQCQWEK